MGSNFKLHGTSLSIIVKENVLSMHWVDASEIECRTNEMKISSGIVEILEIAIVVVDILPIGVPVEYRI